MLSYARLLRQQGRLMDSRIEKFRRHAELCEELAAATKHHDTRLQLLNMARQWRDLIIRVEMLHAVRAPETVLSIERALNGATFIQQGQEPLTEATSPELLQRPPTGLIN
jgi:hypothetical protein